MNLLRKKGYACLAAIAFAFTLMPTMVNAEAKQTSDPETVYVGFIKDGERSTIFNNNWRFFKGDQEGAEGKDFNDSSWRNLNLPHDWSIEGEFTVEGEAESGFLLGGTGWYRKHFVVPEKYHGKDFTLNFDGVYMNAEVYVNGKKLGEHNYGYTAFAFDITDSLVCDGQTENIIAVKVSNPIPTSRWYSGSGIYRDVTLSVTDKIHVAHLGTTVTTPNVESQKSGDVDVNIETKVENESSEEKNVTVKSTVLDRDGNEVSSEVTSNENIAANSNRTFTQTAIVNQPNLWSVASPNMYKVKSEVIVDGNVVDTYNTDFGFRYYNFDRDTGFTLNGEQMKLKGVCMHHDQGSLGSASYYRAVERQMEIMKEMGANAIRVSHNPASEMLLEICDRLGLLVINEAFDTWTNPKNGNGNDFSKFFNVKIGEENEIINGNKDMSWGEFEARAMVKNSKNNPSIIMWSIGNEVLEGIGGDSSKYTEIAQDIINWIKEEDPTRPVTIGDNRTKNGDGRATAISEVVDDNEGIVGFNYATEAQYNQQRNNHPDWILYGSETSSAVHSRGYYKSTGIDRPNLQISEYDNDSTKVGWGHSASNAWKYVIKNDYNAGEFIWTGFDYIGEPTPWNGTGTGSVGGGRGPAPKSSYFGIVDTAGFEKDIYYLYQSQWNEDVNTLHVLPTWNEDGIVIDNGRVNVNVFTDAYKVELYLNDTKVGEETATEHTTSAGYKYYTFGNDALYPSFNVTYEQGTLTAKAFDKEGNEITNTKGRNSVTTSGAATTVNLSADRSTIASNGYDLSYITVDVVDRNGNIVPNAENQLNFNLEGNGKIVGVDNGNAVDTASYKPIDDTTATRKAFSGKALVIVQSTKDAGPMTLNVSGEGLASKSIEINTENKSGDDKYLESYEIIKEYYVGLGEKPELPSTVTGRYSDGTTDTFRIQWNDYDENQLNTPQIFKVTGKLEGTEVAVVVNIHVIGNVVSMENYSTFTYAGTAPTLPKTVKGYLADGSESEEFLVTWNIDNVDFSTPNKTVVVNGNVELLGNDYPVTASVRIVDALKAASNLAINNSSNEDIPSLSQSCTNTSDNLAAINNGVTNNSSATNERWTNWNERSEVVNGEPKGAYVQLDWANKYNIDRIDLWLFTDNGAGRISKKVEISYKNEIGEYVVVPHTNTTEVSYTAGETTYFLDNVINTDSVRIYMQQPEVGKCIGLTEVAVYEYVRQETAKETKTLSEIKLDGKLLEGFDPNTNEYTVNVEAAPKTVEASAEDNAAITILPVNNNKSTIIVRSESGERNKYTINYVLQDTGDSADINGDGTVTIKDLSIASKHFGEVIAGNAISEKCDINKDGIVNDADIQIIMDKILE
ncbi:glycoside hydrolase family 2 TIM barrel-domain containing protein [Clostridium septicum]|uniref:glycoside hydrolase family 2 TIM barrel-domain containing protein n=1 Tax=Clostridium septicum TaxID=1504 RepID=UPI00082A99DC|nr:glycoside hydrolase family 2 TIM barrel-domain containing protein [Clostridium septicum]